MIVDIAKYPFEDEEYLRTLLIGSLLLIGSVLILPAFILIGYFARTVQRASNGESPPQFEDYIGLFIDGIKLTAVGLGYFVLFFIALFVVAFLAAIDERAGTVGFILLVPTYFGLLYIATAAVYHFCQELDMRAAFDFRSIVQTSLSLRYLLVVVLVWVILPTVFTVLQILIGLTIIGILLLPATLIYEFIIYAKLMSLIPDRSTTTT